MFQMSSKIIVPACYGRILQRISAFSRSTGRKRLSISSVETRAACTLNQQCRDDGRSHGQYRLCLTNNVLSSTSTSRPPGIRFLNEFFRVSLSGEKFAYHLLSWLSRFLADCADPLKKDTGVQRRVWECKAERGRSVRFYSQS